MDSLSCGVGCLGGGSPSPLGVCRMNDHEWGFYSVEPPTHGQPFSGSGPWLLTALNNGGSDLPSSGVSPEGHKPLCVEGSWKGTIFMVVPLSMELEVRGAVLSSHGRRVNQGVLRDRGERGRGG